MTWFSCRIMAWKKCMKCTPSCDGLRHCDRRPWQRSSLQALNTAVWTWHLTHPTQSSRYDWIIDVCCKMCPYVLCKYLHGKRRLMCTTVPAWVSNVSNMVNSGLPKDRELSASNPWQFLRERKVKLMRHWDIIQVMSLDVPWILLEYVRCSDHLLASLSFAKSLKVVRIHDFVYDLLTSGRLQRNSGSISSAWTPGLLDSWTLNSEKQTSRVSRVVF